ncbi:Adhesion G protein-coupled receptor L3 [Triplophysa tibetana]|uniref:Adhesion G protein-coupled receptor L3 n=1 Tax=Triplophysa tibetana TaxID=1572043 RepID=A0A5A9PL63_9TELE|nr:Adhesion G protein-coupled receptor L3 [Triplophysa tibetana]
MYDEENEAQKQERQKEVCVSERSSMAVRYARRNFCESLQRSSVVMWSTRLLFLFALFTPVTLVLSRAPVPMAVVRRELSCEGYPIELRCPGTDVIMIESANYGRTDDKICDSDPAQMENTRCYLPDAYKIMGLRAPHGFDLEGFHVFLCPGVLKGVYQSEHLFESDHQSGSWCKDPLQSSNKIYYMPWTPYRTDTLTEYSSKEDFIAGRPTTTYKLPHRVDGTGFVVFDGALFFNKERTRNIVKFDLRTRIKSGEAIIANANYHDTSPYRWGGKSDIDLAVDENGLWVIYATEQNNGRIVVSQLNPYTLRVEGSWDTTYDKRSASNAFMICGILYVVKSVYEDDDNEALGNKIDYMYNTEKSRETHLNIPFPNSYQYIAAVDYNPRDNLLYVWNNLHVVIYSLDFGNNDNRIGYDPPSSVLLPDVFPPVRSSTPPPRPYTGTLRPSLTTSTPITMAPPRRHNNILPEALTRSPPSLQTPVTVDYCAPRLIAEISWPRTHQGQVAKQPCPPGTIGVATFNCLLGYWDPKGPDLSNCTSPWTNHIIQRMRSGETAAIVALELAEQTKNKLRPGDVPSTVKAMAQLVELLDVQLRNLTPGGKDTAARSLNKAMVRTANNLLQPQSQAAWRELSVAEQLRCATMLLDTVETGAFMLADNFLKTDTLQESTDNIQIEVARLSTDGSLADLSFPQSGLAGNTIHLSANTLKQQGRNGEIRIALILYKNLGQYLSTENASVRLGSDTAYPNYSLIVNSPVITAAVNKDTNKVYLSEPVVFTVKHIQQSGENFNPNCSFWSYSKRTMTGYWSTQDCRLLGTNRTHTSCSCTHLTNFAVLMAHVEVKKADQVHELLLDVITWVGILLSLVCLLICIFTFCFFRGLQSDRNTIHKNLCISLFIAETLFLTGINRADQPIVCAVFAALLHFFFLAAFTWMFLEGVQLYIMLVEVFESEYSRTKYFYLTGYGVPAVIVAVSAAVDYRSYGTERVSWVIGAIALLCLLGLTWAFGLMYINESTVIMAYLFTIFNSLQGMFIFIFHCILQKKVRKEYGRCLRTHCCSGKSVESTISTSTKTSTARTPGRYSTNSQSRIRRMWNDTVRKQSESSFITADMNSSATLNRGTMANHLISNALLRPHGTNPYNTLLGESAVFNNPTANMFNTQEGILNNARDSSVMDTLPLNGNHGNSYGVAAGDYLTYSSRGSEPPTTLEKKILKELTANYAPSYLNTQERQGKAHQGTLTNKLNNHLANGGVAGSSSIAKDDVMVLDNPGAFHRHDEGGGLSLELIREESQAPLLPPRPAPTENHAPLHTFSAHRRLPQENSESFFPLLPNDAHTHLSHTHTPRTHTHSPLRDSLYTSMPTLTDLPHGTDDLINGLHDDEDDEEEDDGEEEEGSELHLANGKGVVMEADDVYYKSMPNLGSRNHIQDLESYYQMGRGGSDGFIAPSEKDDSSPEEQPPDPSQLVTSL